MLLLIRALPHLASPLLSRTPQVNSRPVAIPAMAGPGAIKKVPTDRQSGSPNSRRDTRPAPVRVSACSHPPQSSRIIVRRVKSRPLSRFLDATADHAPTDDILCSMRRERPQPWASSYASSSSVRLLLWSFPPCALRHSPEADAVFQTSSPTRATTPFCLATPTSPP